MKKTAFRLLTVALIAILMLFVFAACDIDFGKDNETEAPSIDNNTDGKEYETPENTDDKKADHTDGSNAGNNDSSNNDSSSNDSSNNNSSNNNSDNNSDNNNDNNNNNGESGNPNPENPPAQVFTDGLKFELSADGNSYAVVGIENKAVTDIIIPRAYNGLPVISIGEEAFRGCKGLTSITIPESVTSIGYSAFYGCDNLKYNEYKNGKYLGNEENKYVVLVGVIDKTATSFEINPNTKVIYQSAFYNCKKLTSVTIPDSVTSIGSGAFDGCTGLTSITIPDSVESIGDYAFYFCYGLTSVTIPDSVESIGDRAFSNCTSLESIVVGENNTAYSSQDGILYNKSKTEFVHIPNNLQGAVVIPNGITSIGNYAFDGCTGIESITIPDSVESIGNSAFSGCTGLESVTIPDSVESIGTNAFRDCRGLTSITIGNGVTSIGELAFGDCYKLVEVYNLPSLDITKGSKDNGYVGYYALDIYTSLSEPSKLTTTDDGYVFYENGETVYLLGYKGNETELTLPDKFNNKNYGINKYAFFYNSKITSVTISNSVTSIGERAFYGCYKLVEVYNLSSLSIFKGNEYNNGEVGRYALDVYTSLSEPSKLKTTDDGYLFYENGEIVYLLGYKGNETELTLPDKFNNKNYEIYPCAFYENSKITSVTIPDGVKSIGDEAFRDCTGLTEINFNATAMNDLSYDNFVFYRAGKIGRGITVNIGANVTKIPARLFYKCSYLTTVVFAENSKCTSIGDYAFYYCDELTGITIPDSVESIGYRAFYNCSTLTSIAFEDTSTWYRTSDEVDWSNKTGGTQTDVTTPSTNAAYFKDTYDNYYWYKL